MQLAQGQVLIRDCALVVLFLSSTSANPSLALMVFITYNLHWWCFLCQLAHLLMYTNTYAHCNLHSVVVVFCCVCTVYVCVCVCVPMCVCECVCVCVHVRVCVHMCAFFI